MIAFNHELCEELHRRIESRLDAGEDKMTALERCGNNHEQRLAIMETIAARKESVFWQIMPWVFATISGVVTAITVSVIIGS
jgi:hypothetical protein